MSLYKVAVLTIGDEILIGQIVNTNAAWISEQLSLKGAHIHIHSVVGDNRIDMIAELKRLYDSSNALIITGGLGPTEDDITKSVLAEFFGVEMREFPAVTEYLKDMFEKRGRAFNSLNKLQAVLPENAIVLKNEVGTAPGMQFEKEGKLIFSIPGVPQEMQYLMRTYILPKVEEELINGNFEALIYKTIHTTGIPESDLALLIGETKDKWKDCALAYLPSYWGVRIRLTSAGPTHKEALDNVREFEAHIRKQAKEYIVGQETETVDAAVSKILKETNSTVAVAESCTGGLLGGAFTERPGSSGYFLGGMIVYTNEAKTNQLGVKKETVDNHGAVSEETAIELASRVREKFGSTYGIGVTGVAGPAGGSAEKPVGTVWIGIADENGAFAKRFVFGKDRRTNRELSVGYAFSMLYNKIKKDN